MSGIETPMRGSVLGGAGRQGRRPLATATWLGLSFCVLLLGQAPASPAYAAPTKPASGDHSYAAPDDLVDDPCSARTLAEEEALCRKHLAAMEKAHGPQSREVADASALLARKIRLAGRPSEAEPLDRRALTIILKLVGLPPQTETDASFQTYQDAALFSVRDALATDLGAQGRKLEANLVTSSLRPYDPQDRAHTDPASFYGSVSGVPGVVSDETPAAAPILRAPTAEEIETRSTLRAQADDDDAKALYAQSEPLYRSIVDLDEKTYGPANWETAADLHALAFNLFLQKRGAEAGAIETQAADIEATRPLRTSAAVVSRLDVVTALISEAVALEKRSQDPDAEVLWREALRLDPSVGDMFAEDGDRTALGLADNLRRQNKLAAAEDVYAQALKVDFQALGRSHPRVLGVAQTIAELRTEEGRPGPAVEAYRQACGNEQELVAETKRGERASLASTPLEQSFASCTGEQARAMIAWAQQGGGTAAADRPAALAEDAFVAAQASMPSSAGDALARAAVRIAAASGGAAQEAAQFETDLAERDAIDQELPGAGDTTRDALKARKTQLDTEIAAAAFTLVSKNPAYWDYRSPQPIAVGALHARVGRNAALLHRNEAVVLWMFAPGAAKGLVFAVSKTGFAWAPMGLTGDQIQERVDTLRYGIDPSSFGRGAGPARVEASEPFDRGAAHQLYVALLDDKKIKAVIDGAGIDTLIIVPSGPLTELPPGLLVKDDPKTGSDRDPATLAKTHWLIRDKAIAVLPSVSSLTTLRVLLPTSRQAPDLKLLALADPDFRGEGKIPSPSASEAARATTSLQHNRGGADKLSDLPPLYSTLAEGRTLARLLDPGDADALLLGPDASKTNLLKRVADKTLGRTQVVTFSTHGLLAGDVVGLTEPALALAQPPKSGADPSDDGLLKASEAAALTLNADWVVLSACNTAAGEAKDAQGLSGLARAFFHAGASTLLVSNWRVDDAATEQLITETFRFHKAGKSKAKALQAAMIEMIKEPGRAHVEPRYWAPFVVVGEPQ